MSSTLKLSLDEYEQMIAKGAFVGIERRIELIDGELREMSPAYPVHFGLINRLNRWSTSQLRAAEATVQIQGAIRIGDSLPEPDVAWLIPGLPITQRPSAADCLLVIEVADSSLAFDLGEKMQLYAASGVREYWVVNIADQQIHVHREPSGEMFQDTFVVNKEGTLYPTFKPYCGLNLTELFAS